MNYEICKIIQTLGLRKSVHKLWLCTAKQMPRRRRRLAIVERTNRRLANHLHKTESGESHCGTFWRKPGDHCADLVFLGVCLCSLRCRAMRLGLSPIAIPSALTEKSVHLRDGKVDSAARTRELTPRSGIVASRAAWWPVGNY